MKSRDFFAELKRRKVYRTAVAYTVVSWLLIQAASILLPTFDVPGCVMKGFVALLALGFILSVVISWTFEMTPEGIKRTADISLGEAPDVVRQLETWARQQFVRGYLYALIQAGLDGKTKAIDHLNHDNIDTTGIRVDPMLDSLCGNPRSETLADITRRARPMLRLNKQLRRTFAQGMPAFPAVEQILDAPLTQSVADRKNTGTGH
jgi:hypothetical protein